MTTEITYSHARANLAHLLDEVTENREVVIIHRRHGEDAALIAASELTSLLETAYLLRSPANAERLLTAPDGVATPLSGGEFRLLRILLEHPNRVVRREQLIEMIHGREAEAYDRAIDVQVSRLRHRLRDDNREPQLIKTVRGHPDQCWWPASGCWPRGGVRNRWCRRRPLRCFGDQSG